MPEAQSARAAGWRTQAEEHLRDRYAGHVRLTEAGRQIYMDGWFDGAWAAELRPDARETPPSVAPADDHRPPEGAEADAAERVADLEARIGTPLRQPLAVDPVLQGQVQRLRRAVESLLALMPGFPLYGTRELAAEYLRWRERGSDVNEWNAAADLGEAALADAQVNAWGDSREAVALAVAALRGTGRQA